MAQSTTFLQASAPLHHSDPIDPTDSVPEHLFDPSGQELRLTLGGFVALCTDVCMATGGVFSRFRERSTVRTVADIGPTGVLSHAIFVADPKFYACYHDHAHSHGADSSAIRRASLHAGHRNVSQLERQDPDEIIGQDVSNTASTATKLHVAADLPHSFSFGEFLAHFYYCTKASMEEKILYHLMVASKRHQLYGIETYALEHGFENGARFASPVPDIFTRRSDSLSPTLPLSSLRIVTGAFFCAHLGVLRHIMPLMAYHRAREMRQQLESSFAHRQRTDRVNAEYNSNRDLHTTDPGMTVLALLGLLESILGEAESAIAEAIDGMATDMAKDRVNHESMVDADSALQPTDFPVHIEDWITKWDRQAELLALVSVPGLATMIQIHSQLPTDKK